VASGHLQRQSAYACKRYFAQQKEEKSLAENTNLANEMRSILDWFGTVWTATPPLEKAPPKTRNRYRKAVRLYKSQEIRRMNDQEVKKQTYKKRQLEAILALPPRLRLTALCDVDDHWVSQQIPAPIERLPDYDIDNYRTWPPWVKALFEYNWRPGTQVPLERVARVSYDDDGSRSAVSLGDDDLNFKLDGTRISTTNQFHKEHYSHEEKRALFEKRKIIPIPPVKGGKSRKNVPAKGAAKPKEVRDLERYPMVKKVLDDPVTQERVLQDLDDYMNYLKPAERAELISGLMSMELARETDKLEKPAA